MITYTMKPSLSFVALADHLLPIVILDNIQLLMCININIWYILKFYIVGATFFISATYLPLYIWNIYVNKVMHKFDLDFLLYFKWSSLAKFVIWKDLLRIGMAVAIVRAKMWCKIPLFWPIALIHDFFNGT